MRNPARIAVAACCSALFVTAAHAADMLRQADPPTGDVSLAPRVAPDGEGALLIWLDDLGRTDNGQTHALRFARYENGAWTSPVTIREGGDFFANWADLPCVARGRDGSLLASWLQMAGPGTYAYHVMLARSTDNGATWTELGRVHEDESLTEHGFVSMLPEDDGIRLVWLDGRNMKAESDGGHAGHGMGDMGNMTLRTAVVDADGSISASTELDARTCECCATDVVMTSSGPLVVYRDRDAREIRDTAVVRTVPRGWTSPYIAHADNWIMPACPVNGPAADASGEDVVIAWFTMAGGRASVHAAFSDNSGATFGDPIEIAGGRDAGMALGRADVIMGETGDDAIVVWLHGDRSSGEVRARRVRASGGADPAYALAQTGSSRAGGFPKAIRLGASKSALLIWTDVNEEGATRVRAGVFGID